MKKSITNLFLDVTFFLAMNVSVNAQTAYVSNETDNTV